MPSDPERFPVSVAIARFAKAFALLSLNNNANNDALGHNGSRVNTEMERI